MTIIKAPSGASFFMHGYGCEPLDPLAPSYSYSGSVATLIHPVKVKGWNFYKKDNDFAPITVYVDKKDVAKAITNAAKEGLNLVYNDFRSLECPSYLVALTSDGREIEIVREKFSRGSIDF